MKDLDFDDEEERELRCPYCGEPAEVDVDEGGGDTQVFEQDCDVCCRPWRVTVIRGDDGGAFVTVEREGD